MEATAAKPGVGHAAAAAAGFAAPGIAKTMQLALWVFAAFFINHICDVWVSDLAERDGTAGSMFGGYKYGPLEEFADLDPRPWKSFDDRRRGGT